jgi:hypothetical protein
VIVRVAASGCLFGLISKLYSLRPESAKLLLIGLGLVVLPEFLRRRGFRKQGSGNIKLREAENNELVYSKIEVTYRYILDRLVFYILAKCLRIRDII